MLRALVSIVLLSLFVPAALAQEITVAAAADLNYSLKDLGARYEKKTGNKVTLSFGSSGNLFAQIESGAPYDLFFSADEAYPKKLAVDGFAEPASLRTYAIGHLVLWVPNGSGLDPQKLHIELLVQPSVQRIAIANPEHAPYGRAAMSCARAFWLEGKSGAETRSRREHQPGGAVRAIRQRAGWTDRALVGHVSRDEGRR